MNKFIKEGRTADWTNGTGSAVVSGAVVAFGMQQLGIAETDIASGAVGSVLLDGVVSLTKTTGAITQGQKPWWDAVNSYVINAPAKNAYFLGFAAAAAGSSDATAQAVTLDPASSEQIAGATTHAAIDANNDYAAFQSTGAAWVLVDSEIA